MNDSEMQIAIAEACGYKQQPTPDGLVEWLGPKPDRRYIGRFCPNTIPSAFPDYLNDLNAMHEAEKVLSNGEFKDYFDELESQVPFARPGTKRRHICTAIARQRAEAFLKTLYLWKP
jgi:hypothetical protein